MDCVMQLPAHADEVEASLIASGQPQIGSIAALPIPANQNELAPLLARHRPSRGAIGVLAFGLMINAVWVGGLVWLFARTALR
jgi:hypothetical protein